MNDLWRRVLGWIGALPYLRTWLTGIWALLVAGTLMLGSKLNLVPEAPDAWTYDWRTAVLSTQLPEQRDDIAILFIGEEGLANYQSLSPVDRSLTAKLVRALDAAGAKAIGLDLIFDRSQGEEADNALISAIKNAKAKVVQGVIDHRLPGVTEDHLAFQQELVEKTGASVGHVYLGHRTASFTVSDQVVRNIVPASGDPLRQSFARVLAEVDGKKPELRSERIAWLRPPGYGNSDPTLANAFPTLEIQPHEPGAPIEKFMEYGWQDVVKDRIVLIGGRFFDRDRHLTPFSVRDNSKTHGVVIHAQIVAQILDGRSVIDFPYWFEAISLFIISVLGVLVGTRYSLKTGSLLVWLTGFAGVVIFGFVLFAIADVISPSATFFLAWMGGIWGHDVLPYIERYLGQRVG